MKTDGSTADPSAMSGGARAVATVLLPFGCGYFLSYLFRTVNAVISPQLETDLGIGRADLGLLTGIYFISFAAVQIPLGMMLDRYGPRRIQAGLLLIAALGSVAFAMGDGFWALIVGRALIGVGVSACLMAALKATALWFPEERLPLVNNLIGGFGALGAVAATVPVDALMQVTDWRGMFLMLAGLSALMSAVVWLVVPEMPAEARAPAATKGAQAAAFRHVLTDPFFWRVTAVFVACYAAFLSYQTLWAAPWLRDVAGFDRSTVADHLLLIQIGMLIGVVGIGASADRMQKLGVRPATVMGAGIAVAICVQAVLTAGVTQWLGPLWLAYGLFGVTTFLAFTVISNHFPNEMTARALTVANMLLFIATFFLQWLLGGIMEMFDPVGTIDQGGVAVPLYGAEAHRAAFGLVLAMQVVAFAWYLWPSRKTSGVEQ